MGQKHKGWRMFERFVTGGKCSQCSQLWRMNTMKTQMQILALMCGLAVALCATGTADSFPFIPYTSVVACSYRYGMFVALAGEKA